jgi:hypothetical protein
LLQTESKGGVNQWIDGFHAAHRLYEEDQELFDILTKTPIAYRNITRTEVGEFHNTSSHKLIRFGKLLTAFLSLKFDRPKRSYAEIFYVCMRQAGL